MSDRLPKIGTALVRGSAPFVVSVVLGACQQAPADLREWTPKDHHNQSNQVAAANRQVAANPAPEEAPPPGLDAVTLAAWGANCALCHGKVGRGDGPQGPMVKAPDLSNPEWQLQVSDSQIHQTITSGKKSMPSFAHLPAATVDGLTLLVRWFNRDQAALKQRMNQSSAAPAGSATPASAAPTTGTVSSTGAVSLTSAAASGQALASGPAVNTLTPPTVLPSTGAKTQVKSSASGSPAGPANAPP